MNYLIYFVIPSSFLVFGAIAKRIIRATHWKWSDWFLGVELVLAAMSTGIMHAFDLGFKLAKMADSANPLVPVSFAKEFISVILFIFATIVLFFFVVISHQKWEPVQETDLPLWSKPKQEKWKLLWLAGTCNLTGYLLFAAFIILIKGVS